MDGDPQSILKKPNLLPIFKPKKKNVFISEMQYPSERYIYDDELPDEVVQEDWKKRPFPERQTILLGGPDYKEKRDMKTENGIPLEEFQRQKNNLLNYIRNTIGYENEATLEKFSGILYRLWQEGYFQVISPDVITTNMDDISQIFRCVYDRYMGGFFGERFRKIDRLHRRVEYIINSFIEKRIPVVPLEPEATYNERKLKNFREFCEQVIRQQKGGRKTCKRRTCKRRTCKRRTYKRRTCKKKYNKSCKRK